jgi:hypothetical protein
MEVSELAEAAQRLTQVAEHARHMLVRSLERAASSGSLLQSTVSGGSLLDRTVSSGVLERTVSGGALLERTVSGGNASGGAESAEVARA